MIAEGEATAALDAIGVARKRSSRLSNYARSGDIVIAWGLVWLIGNLATQWDPRAGGWCWTIGIAAAVTWTMWRSRGQPLDWRGAASALTAFAFLLLIETILGKVDVRTHNVLTSSLVAAIYVGVGIWTGVRFAMLGVALAVMIVLGWFVFPTWLYLWLGIGGGGALIVSGLWLRRA